MGLAIFHVLVSTVMPIWLAEIAFPRPVASPWLGRSGVPACIVLLAATIATRLGAVGSRGQKLAVLCFAVAAIAVALALPAGADRFQSVRLVPGLGLLRLARATATIAFFSIFWLVPAVIARTVPAAARQPWQIVSAILMIAFFGTLVTSGRSLTSRTGWGASHTAAVITGAVLPPITLSVVLPAAWHTLEPGATLPALAGLTWLHLALRRHSAALHPSHH